ncbi:YjdJ family protein [Bacillus benzoevorans]|uniref:DUF4306 domain-containing protein n=1 Tax=Bacillus benzoevorans TaxID=1456 RepID=A0A7X0HV73_9BACI|nr:YjdJ family protein [Bacillus benzoevorans]MBB6447444.1 hypothetical protein [Bacillus benzoevorans]
MFRFIFQFGAVSVVFLFSAIAAWYEGSALLDHPSEWKNTTPFTQLFYGPVQSDVDILQWDFFIYAAKYQTTYPMIMLISGLYLLLFCGYYIFKRVKKWYAYYLFWLSGSLFLLCYFHFDSSTGEGYKMFVLLATCASFCFLSGLITYLTASLKAKRMTSKKIVDLGE